MDDLLLSKVRLGVIAALLNGDKLPFSELQHAVGATQGNLGSHLAKLVDAGYVLEEKTFVNRRPQTRYELAPAGRRAFVAHVREMQALLQNGEAS